MKNILLCLALAACAQAAAAPGQPLRDPFARPAVSIPAPAPAAALVDEPETPPRLRALILNGARSLANIDGAIVAVGERAGPYTVVRIEADSVLVSRTGKQQRLLLDEKDKQ